MITIATVQGRDFKLLLPLRLTFDIYLTTYFTGQLYNGWNSQNIQLPTVSTYFLLPPKVRRPLNMVDVNLILPRPSFLTNLSDAYNLLLPPLRSLFFSRVKGVHQKTGIDNIFLCSFQTPSKPRRWRRCSKRADIAYNNIQTKHVCCL